MKKANISKNGRNTSRQAGKIAFRILDICAIALLVICLSYLVRGIVAHQQNDHLTDELREMHEESGSAYVKNAFSSLLRNVAYAEESTASNMENAEQYPVVEDIVIQDKYRNLYERNNDLVGWIHMNESIDYPIVWLDDDNDFYMDHDYDRKYSEAGWIFLDKRNGDLMNDDQLLIYGHNMRSGAMFGDLDLYRKAEYLQKNPIINLESIFETEARKYVIISLYDASMNKDHESYIKITKFNFETKEEKQSYIDEVCSRSIFKTPCSANSDDQLVTLVTCSYSQPNGRFLVVARELRDDETVEQITEMYLRTK